MRLNSQKTSRIRVSDARARPGACSPGKRRCGYFDVPVLHPARAEPHPRDAGQGLGHALGSLLRDAAPSRSRRSRSRWSAASRWRCCSRNRAIVERAFFPFAVIMQVTPVVAIAPLLLIYLSANTAVLVCAFLVAFFPDPLQHRARPLLGRPQSARSVPALPRLALAAACSGCGCRPRCPIFSAACASAAASR